MGVMFHVMKFGRYVIVDDGGNCHVSRVERSHKDEKIIKECYNRTAVLVSIFPTVEECATPFSLKRSSQKTSNFEILLLIQTISNWTLCHAIQGVAMLII